MSDLHLLTFLTFIERAPYCIFIHKKKTNIDPPEYPTLSLKGFTYSNRQRLKAEFYLQKKEVTGVSKDLTRLGSKSFYDDAFLY